MMKQIPLPVKILLFFLLIRIPVHGQPAYTSAGLINKDLLYRFGEHVVMMNFSSDTTLYWKVIRTSKEANEVSKTIHLNEYTTITAWYEADKTFVSLYSDFSKMETHAMVCREDGRFYPIKGTIELVE
jgi:uncharacterized protein YbaR (Trm112 family)